MCTGAADNHSSTVALTNVKCAAQQYKENLNVYLEVFSNQQFCSLGKNNYELQLQHL